MKKNDSLSEKLFDAIERNDLCRVISLINKGACPNSPSAISPFFRPLEFALDEMEFECSLDVVKALIKAGADVNAWDIPKSTRPIHHAVFTLNYDCILLLLENGADPNCVSDTGHLPLTYVVDAGEVGLAELLIQFGADKTMHDCHFAPPYNALNHAVKNVDVDMVKLLLNSGADPQFLDIDGYCASHYLPKINDDNKNTHKLILDMLSR